MSDREEPGFDPSDWLEKQFAEADADEPTSPPTAPQPPAAPEPPAVPPAPAVPPVVPPTPYVPQDPGVSPSPVIPSAPTIPPASPASAGGFTWGLTPGADPSSEPVMPPAAPAEPAAPAIPSFDPTIAFPQPAQPVPTAEPTIPAEPVIAEPAPTVFPPTIAFSSDAPEADLPPAPPVAGDAPTTALEPAPWEPWQSRPIDPALEGVTEIIEAEIVGVDSPEGESNPTPGLDDLFGDGQFRDYGDEPIITGPPPPAGPKPPRAAKGERAPVSRVQKVLLWVAGGLVAALALVALFVVGTRLPALLGPAPALTPSPTPTPTPTLIVLPAGPLAPGEYQWDELLGGECLDPFESAWQDRYTVVDCATPHPAQMTARGRFEDALGTPFPGAEELQKRINLLCTAATVINYQVASTAIDIQVSASFPVDEADWDSGNRTYFCFVNRSSGENLTASVAVPQPAVTLTPAPVAP